MGNNARSRCFRTQTRLGFIRSNKSFRIFFVIRWAFVRWRPKSCFKFKYKTYCNVCHCILIYKLIKSFKQPWLETFWNTRKHKKVPTELKARIIRKLDMMNSSKDIKDLASSPSNIFVYYLTIERANGLFQ